MMALPVEPCAMDFLPDFEKGNGLVPVVVQEDETGEVLMLAWMNRAAWESTLAEGRAVYWSRSRKCLWFKGDTSGHVQQVRRIFLDCDKDSILLKVTQVGQTACHTGRKSCFYREVANSPKK